MANTPSNPNIGNSDVLAAIAETNKLLSELIRESPKSSSGGGSKFEMPETHKGEWTPQNKWSQAGSMLQDVQKGINKFVGGPSAGASTPQGLFGRAGNALNTASNYVPKAEAYAGVINQGVIQPAYKYGAAATDLNQMGAAQGISAGSTQMGPLGVTMPFNPAFNRGVEMKVQALKDSMQGGVTVAQAENIQQAAVAAGYKTGGSQFNGMRHSLQALTKINPLMGQDPMAAELYTRGSRYGASSDSDFVEAANQLNDTIKNTNVSVAQALQDATAYTNLLAKTGGNPSGAAGMALSSTMQNITGLSGPTSLALQGNGYVQAMQMKGTGLMPWQLGQMDNSQRAMMTMKSVNQLGKMLGPSPGGTKITTDSAGFQHMNTAQDRQDANTAMMMGVDTAVIKNMRKNYKRDMAFGKISTGFAGYEETAGRISSSHLGESQKLAKLQALNNQFGGKGTVGALHQQMEKAGFSQDQMDKIMKAGDKASGSGSSKLAAMAHLRNQAFQDELGKKTGKQQGASDKNKVMVGLTNDAKKLLKIEGSSDNSKVLAGAGIGTVVGGALGALSFTPVGVAGGAMLGEMIGSEIGSVL